MKNNYIYHAVKVLGHGDKEKEITENILLEVKGKFPYNLYYQMHRDAQSRFKLWDSLSMCEQSDDEVWGEAFDRKEFLKWAFTKIKIPMSVYNKVVEGD